MAFATFLNHSYILYLSKLPYCSNIIFNINDHNFEHKLSIINNIIHNYILFEHKLYNFDLSLGLLK